MSRILSLSPDTNFYLYRKLVKMTSGFDRLTAMIRSELNKDVFSGDVFIFLNRTRTTIKILIYVSKLYRRYRELIFTALFLF